VRRNFFFQSAASHRDPFKELGIEHAPAKCPHCAVELTDDLRVKENAAFAAMSEPQRKVFLRERAKSHAGALGEEIVFIMDHVERAPSALHIRTNCSTYNMTVTFMRLPYSSERRLEANKLLKFYKVLWKFPLNKKSRTPKMVGNDARAFDSNAEILPALISIWFPEAAEDAVDADRLAEVATAANDLAAAQEACESRPRQARKKKRTAEDEDDVTVAGGQEVTEEQVGEYRLRRERASAAAEPHDAVDEPELAVEFGDDEDGDHDDDLLLDEDAELGVKDIVDVWLRHMEFQTALHSSKFDDSVLAEREYIVRSGRCGPSPPPSLHSVTAHVLTHLSPARSFEGGHEVRAGRAQGLVADRDLAVPPLHLRSLVRRRAPLRPVRHHRRLDPRARQPVGEQVLQAARLADAQPGRRHGVDREAHRRGAGRRRQEDWAAGGEGGQVRGQP
jgi:hypothetical protein